MAKQLVPMEISKTAMFRLRLDPLKALLLVNEQLEAELAQVYAAVAQSGLMGRGHNVLH